MRPIRASLAAALFCLAVIASSEPTAQAQENTDAAGDIIKLNVLCMDVGNNLNYCREEANLWAESKEIEIRVLASSSTDETLASVLSLFSIDRPSLDIIQYDITWAPHLSGHLMPFLTMDQDAVAGHLPAMAEAGEFNGLRVGLPYMMSTGILYYRQDLLDEYQKAIPTTWSSLASTAQDIQGEERKEEEASEFWGLSLAGVPGEDLTVQALEWIASHGGGSIVGEEGRSTVSNPGSEAALSLAASWIGTIASPDVLTYEPEQARAHFELGQAMFHRGWSHEDIKLEPPVAEEGQPVELPGRVASTVLPSGTGEGSASRAALAGWLVGVASSSKQPQLAQELAQHFASEGQQRVRAFAGIAPTWVDLYNDRDILSFQPDLAPVGRSLTRLAVRPSHRTGRRYPDVSEAFSQAVHDILAGDREPATVLTRLNFDLNRMSRGGRQW